MISDLTKITLVKLKHLNGTASSQLVTSICGFNPYSTEHPRLFVTIILRDAPDFPPSKPVGSEDVNLLNYINSKFVYAMRHTKQEIDRLFRLFEQKI